MTQADWSNPLARGLALYLDGADAPDRADDGTPLVDDDFLLLVNGWWEPLEITVPPTRPDQGWHVAIDTFDPCRPNGADLTTALGAGGRYTVGPRSLVVLRGIAPTGRATSG
jgi:glycogen operon protein